MRSMRKLESEWYWHQAPTTLPGGKITVVETLENMWALVNVNVPSLGVLEPFKRYQLKVRRHLPQFSLGLQLKFKAIGNVPFDPAAYTGTVREVYNGHGHEIEQNDVPLGHEGGFCGGGEGEEGCRPEVIERTVLSEVFDAVMFGFGNTATTDDICSHDNVPFPFIQFYINDAGKVVLMPNCCPERRRNRGVVVVNREIELQPFTAKTMQISRDQTEFTRPHSHRSADMYVQGSFSCGDHGRGRASFGRGGAYSW